GRGLGIRDEALFLEVCLAFDCLEHNPVAGVASVVIREGLSSKAADALDVHQGAAQHSDGSHSRSVLHLADGTVGTGNPLFDGPVATKSAFIAVSVTSATEAFIDAPSIP